MMGRIIRRELRLAARTRLNSLTRCGSFWW